ncbi:hypothetical protein ACFLWF_00130 [Chloroflexota bacterium]
MINTIRVLDPTAHANIVESQTATRLTTLDGKVLGLIWNSKPNGDMLLKKVGELLSKSYKLAGEKWYSKPIASIPLDDKSFEDIISKVDVVINAVGD